MKALQMLARHTTQMGGVSGMWHAFKPYVMITDPAAAECVLKSALSKDDLMKVTHIVLGNGSIFASVPIWRPRRKILAPTFSPKKLNSFVEIFSQQSIVLTEQIKAAVGKGPVSVWQYLNSYTMDAVCETTMGIKVGAQTISDNVIVQAIDTLCLVAARRMLQPWMHPEFVFKKLPYYSTVMKCKAIFCGFVDKMVQDRRKIMKDRETSGNENDVSFKTFIDLMMESSKKESAQGYSDLELREETIVMVIAGTDTSAVGTSFTLVMLSKYPDVQDKVYQELQEVFGDSDRSVVAEDLPRLKYLTAVIKETLRLYPPVPIIARKIDNDVKLPSGVTLVDQCSVVINIWGVHQNPAYWGDDAEEFRPERFIDTPLKHPAAFMPFSSGPRNCLGYQYAMMSMKTAISTLLRSYKILPAQGGTSEEDLKKPLRAKYNVMMRDADNYTVQLECRNKHL